MGSAVPGAVAVAGAGAVGCHYGAQLLRGGAKVRFLARGAQLQALKRDGLIHRTGGEERHYRVEAVGTPEALADCSVWLLCCKTTGLAALLDQIAPFVDRDALLVTLQNGVRAGEITAGRFPGWAVAVASAFIGARIERPGVVLHSAAGHISLARWQGDHPAIGPLLACWRAAGTEARLVADGRLMLWRKMVWNCGFNAICAITRRYARAVAEDSELAAVAEAAMGELVRVANAQGIALTGEDVARNMAVTREMGPVKPSAWQDLERGRPTEVADLNGEVVRSARACGLDAPVNRTLTALLLALQRDAAGDVGRPAG
ncbi:MAG: 2-dehydropantoate 2-reductase [Zetaproteobacteria bacterium]|nr:MAG: 2-dehydropantoate 2-reductase [Zetaproteobacteria bacterium]